MDFFLTNTHILSSPDINWWTGVVTCGLLWCFISCLDSHSDGTHSHSLVSKWCNATFLQIWRGSKLIYILDDLRVNTFSASVHFLINLVVCFHFHCAYYSLLFLDDLHGQISLNNLYNLTKAFFSPCTQEGPLRGHFPHQIEFLFRLLFINQTAQCWVLNT